ncbi:MAG TPA: FUSC family protein, partial [Solirubrobacteraceae bacterium]|nr:FUSC family protein [Solirubrobacteraceae bacterium]
MANAVRRITLSAPRRAWIATARRGNWLPVWSPAAALRAIRAALVLTSLFALTDKVIGNLQMATFAAFGSFATLVLASFSGSWREKLRAHLALALAGSVLLTIGTAVASSTAVAVLVTVPVAFAVFFAGVTGPNAAGGVTGALLAYVLPAASPGAISMVPDRLAGWWLASVAGTAAVLALSPRPGANPLRAASAKLASSLADQIETALDGRATAQQLEALIFDKHELMERFSAAPYRPTGLTAVEEALANCVELLEWTTYLVADGLRERSDLRDISAPDRELLGTASDVLRDSASLLAGRRARPDLAKLAELRARAREIRGTQTASAIAGESGWREAAQASFHAHAIASAVLAAARDVAKACGLDEHADVLARRSRAARSADRVARVSAAVARDASVRSVWFINSVRGAVALAGAVAVADVSSVQHGFWVVLGTLSVLRTNASSTGSTALRALVGTAIGFVIGGALLLAIGAASAALWIVLPIAVLVAAYTPGTAPFAFGQAAFTVTIAVLFNLLVP